MTAINNRYEFVYLFDATNSNPNGDPDAGNLPRSDPETSRGLVTDVCLKRKIRNYVAMSKANDEGFGIYITEKAILNDKHKDAYKHLGLEETKKSAEVNQAREFMCKHYYDVRTFGAVMSTGANCGQVRGPVQLAFATSVDPIFPLEISITRMAVADGKETDDDDKKRTMGRKHIVPYGLHPVHGFISAKLAEQTGFGDNDLDLFWQALRTMFEHDRSAARGEMVARGLYVFKHSNKMGNAPAHKLFELIKVKRIADKQPVRSFNDYQVEISNKIPEGVELTKIID